MLKTLLSLLILLSQSLAAQTWDVVPVEPVCRAGVFCEEDEVGRQVELAGIVRRLVAMAERALEAQGHVDIAFMSFTEPSLFTALCDLTKRGLSLHGFFDSKAGPPEGLGFRLESECQKPGARNVKMHYMGMPKDGRTGWRLHHNKFLVAHLNNNQVEMAFGSANLTTHGLGLNFENWNFMRGTRTDAFIADHICDIQAMKAARAAGLTEDDPEVFRLELRRCLSYRSLDPAEMDQRLREGRGAWALFTPDPEDEVFEILEHQIDRVVSGGRIRMAVYFFMHLPIVRALERARLRGVSVDLLIDDDIQNGSPKNGQRRFYEAYLTPKVSHFNVRVFDTNEAIYQMQHHKYLVLEGVGEIGRTRVFAGAGQFTLAAFQRNFENFYLIERSDVVTQFAKIFENLWQKATPVPR